MLVTFYHVCCWHTEKFLCVVVLCLFLSLNFAENPHDFSESPGGVFRIELPANGNSWLDFFFCFLSFPNSFSHFTPGDLEH